MLYITLNGQPVNAIGNILLTTVGVPPVKGSIDESFETGSGLVGSILYKIIEKDGEVNIIGNQIGYNGTSSINASKTYPMIALKDDGSIDTSKITLGNLNGNSTRISKLGTGGYILQTLSTFYHTNPISQLIKLNEDLTLDSSFLWTGNVTYGIGLSDGKILVAKTDNTIVRLNNDGSVDGTFTTVTRNNTVSYMIERPDGKYVAIGTFTQINGSSKNHIVVMNTDGTIDSFTAGTGINNQSTTRCVAQSDNKIILYGGFTTYGGTTKNRIARVNTDGTLDGTFTTGTGFNSTTIAAIQSDGKIIVSGNFTTYNGGGINRVCRLNTDGSLDGGYSVGTGFNVAVATCVIDSNDRAFFGGSFTTYNSVANTGYCLKLNTDGTKYTGFNQNLGFDGIIFGDISVLCPNNSVLLISPNHRNYNLFTSYNGILSQYRTKTTNEGAIILTEPQKTGFNNTVLNLLFDGDKRVFVGNFTSYDGVTANRIVRLNEDGTVDTTLVSGTGFGDAPADLIKTTDGKYLLVGNFTTYNGTGRNYIVKIGTDGVIDGTFGYTSGFSGALSKVFLADNDKIITCFTFAATYNGLNNSRIHRLNFDGTIDNAFMTNIGTGPNGSVAGALQLSTGKILVYGSFTTWNGVGSVGLVILNGDGTVNLLFTTGASTVVRAIELDNGKIVISGNFTTYKGTTVNRLACFDDTGTLYNIFGTGVNVGASTGPILGKGIDNKIYVGGNFTTYDGQTANRIVRIHI